MSFALLHITVRWTVDSIENNIFRFSASQFMLRSSLSLKVRLSSTKTQTTPPLRFFII